MHVGVMWSRTARAASVVGLALLGAPHAWAESPWGGAVGAGLSALSHHDNLDATESSGASFIDYALGEDVGHPFVLTAEAHRVFGTGPFSLGARLSYSTFHTPPVIYEGTAVARVAYPARVHMLSLIPVLRAGRVGRRLPYAGAGLGPVVVVHHSEPDDPIAPVQGYPAGYPIPTGKVAPASPTDAYARVGMLALVGVQPAAGAAIELVWRRVSDVDVLGDGHTDYSQARITTLELGLRFQFGH
jgi:hypothetical protein